MDLNIQHSIGNKLLIENNTILINNYIHPYVYPLKRYGILPYDDNRVILNAHIDDTDYINASWITGRREIATQGPLPNTVIHFLQMICEQNVEAIVMLTKTIEGNRQSSFNFESFSVKGIVKCEQYWPEVDQSLVFDHMVIKTLEETEVIENEFYQRRLQIEGKFFSSSTCFR